MAAASCAAGRNRRETDATAKNWLISQYARASVFDNWTTGRAVRKYVDSLDPNRDDEEITGLVANRLFADPYFAHATYLVTFARQASVPAIAKVLYRSGNGDIATDPRRRNNDTIVYFSEFYRRGYSSPEGREAIAKMEQIHSNFRIPDELKLYTLATVMLEPDRLAAQYGHDPLTAVDKQARWVFWCGVAAEMNLTLPVSSRAEFEQWMLDYEAANYKQTKDSLGCFEGLVKDWLRWYPKWLPRREWAARQSLSALMAPEVRHAMGAPDPIAPVRATVWLVSYGYLRLTNFKLIRKNRSLARFFGEGHSNPQSLEGIGHIPRSHSRRATPVE